MAAASPRKSRRTKGKHRKPSNFQSSTYAHWLGIGAVGIGLVASAANATGVASADDSSGTNSKPSAPSPGTAATKKPDGANHNSKAKPKRPTTTGSTHATTTTDGVGDAAPAATPRTPSAKAHGRKQAQTDPAPSAHPAPASATHSWRPQNVAAAPSARTPAVAAAAPTNVVVTPASATTPTAAPTIAVATAATSSAQNAKTEPKPSGFQAAIDDVLKKIGLGSSANFGSSPVGSVDAVVPTMWLAARQHRNAQISQISKLPAATTTTSDVPPAAAEPAAATDASTTTTLSESEREALSATLNKLLGWIPGLSTVSNTLGQDLSQFTHAVQHTDLTGIADEIGKMALDVIGTVPVVGALLTGELNHPAMSAAAVSTAAVSAAATSTAAVSAAATSTAAVDPTAAAFLFVLQRAVDRLAGTSSWIWHNLAWAGTPQTFVSVATNQIDQALDAADTQLNALIANPPAGSPAAVISGLVSILNFWSTPAIPTYTFADTLNALGDFLNRIVPQVQIASGAGTLSVISVYKIVGAAVAGTATALSDMLNNVYDPQQIEIDVIYTTTGATVTRDDLSNTASLETKIAASILVGGGVYSNPGKLLSMTLPTWTAAQVNPSTIVTYIVLVALYKRFQEISNYAQFSTSTTYESWLYTIGSGSSESEYAAGTFTALDQDGRAVNFQPADGNTYTSAWGALVTINTYGGGYTYTATLPGTAYFHAGAAGQSDTVTIPVYTADGAPYNVTFAIKIIGTQNNAPTVSSSVGSADALGVVRGAVTGTDADGDTLTYSLVSSSVTGLSGNSAYTTNGGTVTLNSSTGAFTYTSTATGGSSASFQVQVDDSHGGVVTTTVTVPNSTAITAANINTATQGVVTGSLPAPTADAGMFTYTLGTGPSNGTLSFNPTTGAFTYTRTAAGHTAPAADSFTVIATDANGRTVTLQVPVQPTIANTAPTATLTTAPTVGTLSGTTQTSTGKFTGTDADGDTITYTATTGSQGGTLTFNPDGSFTYTGNLSTTVRHAAAKIGATSAQMNDTFTVTASDGFGGTATYTVNVPIYAINTPPTITGFGGLTCAFGVCTVGTMTISDADGDSIPNTAITPGAGAGYTLGTGSVTVWGSGTTTISWSAGGTLGTTPTANTFTVYDGYYTVTNGVVNVGTLSQAWAQWAAGSGTRTTGN
ncbi:Ig-like domain-containing protein [Mycobacterium sp. OTB74]|uniref:beta strand repeat-containing protein n=1 Tax=Mycobacterium sp. OTB74 TaxID=1853452 RepID=UPI0024758246|nr:Ig-like domain-containing protein [Mycobacterium sp. OTB74]MDH6245914.1 VCBS repeat-containing protein [Mycobacterium sp. OTB74]